MLAQLRRAQLEKRHFRIRKKVRGTSERPRLAVRRSHLNLFAQAIDDLAERTLLASSTLNPELRKIKKMKWGNVEGAKTFGKFLAEELKKKKLTQVVFDRGGWPYHGRLKAFAEALRENGIKL